MQFVAITLLLSREHDSCFVAPGKKRGTSAESADAGTLPVACGFLNVFLETQEILGRFGSSPYRVFLLR